MSLPRTFALLLLAGLAGLAGVAEAQGNGYLLGGGLEADADSGLRASVLASVGITEATWLSGSASTSQVDLPRRGSSDIVYADIDLDHHFDPLGFSLGAAYWGDPDILDSVDLRASLYYKNDRVTLASEFETRDFDFVIPPSELFAGREIAFDADGIGGRARFRIGKSFSIAVSAMRYDYSVDFVPNENRDAIRLVTVSRLGLINNLVDSRARLEFGLDAGLSRWELDFSTWKGALDRARTRSVTVRYLTPLGRRTDIEFGLGFDDSDLYGNTTLFSEYLYFYGT
jgi:hypothetical protein